MEKWKQCDYIIGNWIVHGEVERVSNDIFETIVGFYCKDANPYEKYHRKRSISRQRHKESKRTRSRKRKRNPRNDKRIDLFGFELNLN